MKGGHLLYQLRVVSDNVNIELSLTRLWKRSTQSVMTVTSSWQNHLLFSCVHTQKFLNRFLSKVDRISLEIKRSKNSSLVSSLAKPLKSLKPKPSLQNQPSIKPLTVFFVQTPSISIKGPRLINHDQFLIESNKKP